MPPKCEQCGKYHSQRNNCYSEQDYKRFKQLVYMSESVSQMRRIESRLHFPKFIEQHGKQICDLMFARLQEEEPL